MSFDVICNRQGERLDFTMHGAGAEAAPPSRVAIIGHGVTSNKDRPWLLALAGALAGSGVPALRFSFAGNGRSEGCFDDATLSKEVDDLGSVIDALTAWGVPRLAYIGHSMGGAIGVMRAAADPRIACLVSLAGMIHVRAFMDREFGHLQPGRDLMLDKPGCVWNRALAADAARIGSLTAQAAEIRVPWLLVHGEADELVPFADAEDARRSAAGQPTLTPLADVDHRFTNAVPAMIDAVVPWVQKHL